MASTDSLPIPRKNVAYRVVFEGRKNDGSLITSGTGMDSEISKDQGTFTDCTNEATEIATTSGVYYLDLTASEMNADCVAVKVTWTNSNALPQVIALYPQEAGDIRVNTTYWADASVASVNSAGFPRVDVALWRGFTPNSPIAGRIEAHVGEVTDGVLTLVKFGTDTFLKLRKYIQLLVRKDAFIATDNATELAELNASGGSGAGTFSAATDSTEAIRDRGDVAWVTGAAADLAPVLAAIAALSAEGITVISPVNALTGNLELIRGDDYLLTSGRVLPQWTSADWIPYDLTDVGATVTFKAKTKYGATVFEAEVDVVSATLIRLELTNEETEDFAIGRDAYAFDIEAELATGDVITLVRGKMSILEDVR